MCGEPEQLSWAAYCLHGKFDAKWHQNEGGLIEI
jgi:hypothetical protein